MYQWITIISKKTGILVPVMIRLGGNEITELWKQVTSFLTLSFRSTMLLNVYYPILDPTLSAQSNEVISKYTTIPQTESCCKEEMSR